jgi:lathosterol oxidase
MSDFKIIPTFFIILFAMLCRYFVFAGLMYRICSKTPKSPLSIKDIQKEQMHSDVFWSIISTIIFAVFGTFLTKLWSTGGTQIYYSLEDYGLFYTLFSLPLLLFLQDTYFYWTHRLLHHPAFFKRFHLAHHRSKFPTAWTSFAFHPVEAIIQALILPVLLIVFPVHWIIFILFLMIMSFFGVFNHLGYEFLPRFLEFKLGIITASHHHVHHQKVQKNFGLFFNWWDLLMKTEFR